MQIKVCGMRQPDNIKQLVRLNPDYIGFIFYKHSKRYIGDQVPEEIIKLIPTHIQKVGVFVDEPFHSLLEKYHFNKLDILQLHGNELPCFCLKLQKRGIKVIKAFLINEEFDFESIKDYEPCCDYFLFDAPGPTVGGTGKKFNWDLINQYKGNKPFFLSGGIGPGDWSAIKKIQHPACFAIDINSGFETEPGLKDMLKVGFFMDGMHNIYEFNNK